MHCQPLKCYNDVVSIPKELKVKCNPMTSSVDSLVISRHVFLASVGKPMCFQDAQVVKNKKNNTFHEALDHTMCQCTKAGHIVQTISCDKELKAMMDPVHNNMNIDEDHTTPGDHESAVEHNNCTVQEWHHAALH